MRVRLASFLSGRTSSLTAWICRDCQTRAHRYKSSLQSSRPEKPFYVTTPIFYVNAAPHLGHLYSLVVTDIFKRWAALRGKKAILCTGTDEHGLKVQQAAAKAGEDVRAFCEENSRAFLELAVKAGVDHDHFIRTSDPKHHFAVQHFWMMLNERGHIYNSKHEGWYSISDETFYPQSAVQLLLDPSTGRKFMASLETGNEVEWTSEKNYHFRMSAFKDRLLDFYKRNPQFIIPSTRMKEVISHVQSDLNDLSISRPVERLQWGIPVPDDSSQIIYVWLDALVNYLTKSNYPFQEPGQEDAGGWPADVHVIGKDIVRFHGIYWPAFLMALDLPLPRQILAHAHWTLGRQKMSKTRGNVVNPFFALERFGVDGLRYFLALKGGIKDDAMYDNDLVAAQYENDLQKTLGNLLSRVIRFKGWDVRRAVQRHELENNEHCTTLMQMVRDLPSVVSKKIEKQRDLGSALESIMRVIRRTNSYMNFEAPWDYINQSQKRSLKAEKEKVKISQKNPEVVQENPQLAEETKKVDRTVYLCAESLRVTGILLQPYMPSKIKHLLDLLGVNDDARTFEHANIPDYDFGIPAVPIGRGLSGTVFPPLSSEE